MSLLKKEIALNILDILNKKNCKKNVEQLANFVILLPINKNTKLFCNAALDTKYFNEEEIFKLTNDTISTKDINNNHISNIFIENSLINIQLIQSKYPKAILEDIKKPKLYSQYNLSYRNDIPDVFGLAKLSPKSKIVVEYSSPNIAKPFHVGHLRSTIIGQFISNLLSSFGHHVIRINYLGDWGNQFALLGVGLKRNNKLIHLNQLTVHDLLKTYIKVNKDALVDPTINIEAKEFLSKLENGDKESLLIWKHCREISLKEIKEIYERLNVNFSYIHSESMYFNKIDNFIEKLGNRLFKDSNNSSLHVDLTLESDISKIYATLKNDNETSLYLSRDVAAALERINTLSANKLLYIVENGQHLHFTYLTRILESLKVNIGEGEMHVKFGRIEGMSTRRGNFIPLVQLLDEAEKITKENILTKKTTKVEKDNIDYCAKVLAHSAVFINDLKRHRLNNYKFDWSEALNFNGNSGIFLQYTHSRLNSLLTDFSQELEQIDLDYSLLTEDSALRLILHLARFDEILIKCHYELEACYLVNYLFVLCRLTNIVHKDLHIKNQKPNLAKIRLYLFDCAQTVLYNGLKLLGINPLKKI